MSVSILTFVFGYTGMVELVPSSETLRKIQVEYGVTGSFKDKPLAEWLRKYNPAEDEYEKVHLKLNCMIMHSSFSQGQVLVVD